MSIIEKLMKEFDKGRRPSELVREGYPRSTVYTAYKRWLALRHRMLPKIAVFISHDINDFDVVMRLYELLKASGIEVYMPHITYDPPSGSALNVEEKIRRSDYVLAIIAKEGPRKELVHYELGCARAYKKPIIALIEKGVEPPPYLTDREYVYFDPANMERSIEYVIEFLNKVRVRKQEQAFQVIAGLIGLTLLALFGIAIISVFIGRSEGEEEKED